jgi:hypothetical protein
VTRPALPDRGFDALLDTLASAPVKPPQVDRRVVYAGSESQQIQDTRFVAWRDVGETDWEPQPSYGGTA